MSTRSPRRGQSHVSRKLPLVLEELVALDELSLQRRVIMPLLTGMGFANVRENSGSGEHGKDVIATKEDLSGTLLYAFQIKKLQLTAKAGTSRSLGRHIDQLGQTLLEPVVDPSTNRFRQPDRSILVTPYPVSAEARSAFSERLQSAGRGGVSILDGTNLLDRCRQYAPSVLEQFSDASRYRMRLAHDISQVHETAAALALPSHLKLDTIYVEATTAIPPLVEKPDGEHWNRPIRALVPMDEAQFRELCVLYEQWTGRQPVDEVRRFKVDLNRLRVAARLKSEKLIARHQLEISNLERLLANAQRAGKQRSSKLAKAATIEARLADKRVSLKTLQEQSDEQVAAPVDLARLCTPIIRRIATSCNDVEALADSSQSSAACTLAAQGRLTLRRELHDLEHAALEGMWKLFLRLLPATAFCPVYVPSRTLSRVDTNLFILGRPGAGKTTLLRLLCRSVAESRRDRIPIFVPLVDLSPTQETIINKCVSLMDAGGYRISSTDLIDWLERGAVTLCLDGLDETGGRAKAMLDAVSALSERFRRTQIILSCRDTFGIKRWEGAFSAVLEPLNDEQIRRFVSKWPHFSREEQGARLLSWLERSESMRRAAATPLICALLCSLSAAGADLPNTESELYDGRLDLLLGKWDQAKGVPTLPSGHRRRYRHFLMQLAFRLHQEETRDIDRETVLAVADDYTIDGVHRGSLDFLNDCVRRGVLECDESGHVSFGHLTYQEHLAAQWLSERNDVAFVWEHINEPWWLKTLEFYAARKGDIRELIELAMRKPADVLKFDRLQFLASLARDTPKRYFRAR